MLELCHKMGINDISGSTYKDIKNLANDLGVELKFSYKRGYSKHSTAKIPLENILVEHSPYKSLSKIRNRLIKEGLKEHRCEICGNNEWNGRPIPLQLHHINGNPTDNRIENLQVLCPNCHAQTDNYSGKNSYKDLDVTSSKIIEEYNEPKTFEETHHSRENLLSDFKELGSFTKIGKKYNVTEAAIRKWFSYYKLPRYAKDVKNMLGMKK